MKPGYQGSDWMALGDLMAAPLFSQSSTASTTTPTIHADEFTSSREDGELEAAAAAAAAAGVNYAPTATTTTSSIAYLPQTVVLCDFRHEGFEEIVPLGTAESGLVSRWRPKDRVSLSFKFYFFVPFYYC